MFASFRKMLRRAPSAGAAEATYAAQAQRAQSARAATAPGRLDAPAGGVGADTSPERRFTAILVGAERLRSAPAQEAERRVIARIAALAQDGAQASVVPRLPLALPRLMSAARRADISLRELSEQLALDPTLVAEVVRLANAPRYRTSREITSLQDALTLLGQRGLLQVVTGAALRPVFDAGYGGRFTRRAGRRVWDLAQRCAHACAFSCTQEEARFPAYLAGMVADIGMIPALRVLDEDYWEQHAPDTQEFHDALAGAVAALSARLARQWQFDPSVCAAVAHRTAHGPAHADGDVAEALRRAGRISRLQMLDPGLADEALAYLDASERRCYAELERAFGDRS